ncbi:MAG: peptide MFS transporter [Bacteroidetes bacterium]|nr:peptide MFS transporter [Bacteroidota bacterium]
MENILDNSEQHQNRTELEKIQDFKGTYPRQLWYLFLVEMWERFCFYGMRALLGLYISHLILSVNYNPLPANELNAKKQAFYAESKEELNENHPRYYIETSQQQFRDKAEKVSNKRYGLIQAFIYAMAFLGGLFADRLFGFRRSIFWGGILMAIGTFFMAMPGSFAFYFGVSVLIVGNGFFKPNISTMIGDLYKPGDPRRDAGYGLFYSGINIGALLSGLTIAWIGTSYSWSLGFALAGICMLLGLGLFVFTQKSLGPIGKVPDLAKFNMKWMGIKRGWMIMALTLLLIPGFFLLIYFPFELDMTWLLGQDPMNVENGFKNMVAFSDIFMISLACIIFIYLIYTLVQLAREELGKMIAAIVLILFSVLFWSFFEQGGGSLNFFANGNVESHGLNMTSVNNSINSLSVVLLSPLVGLLWVFLARKKMEPNTVVKFGLGFLFLGLGFLVFYMSRFSANPMGKTPLMFFILAYLVVTIGELCLSPIGLSMVTKLSPKRFVGMMMGTWFLASAYGQYGAGIIGASLASGENGGNLSNIQKLELYTNGYRDIGYIAIAAGVLLVVLSPFLRKLMGTVK